MKHLIHTGFGFEFPEIIGKINKITEMDNGLKVDATMDTEKLDKFKEDLDAWIRSERAESSVLEVFITTFLNTMLTLKIMTTLL